ncbi:hypothetical protein LCGC14_0371380 [marine sediment metagenome]|uniref:Uncharacterized protein n=1 Tax=marine sediment metagenome TaxID=412755 RepID=A0A0F9VS60_9ZZZZ|nr:hypothetical protein [bacterium]
MVDYTGSETVLLNAALGLYKRTISPDIPIDRTNKDVIIAALDNAHAGGKIVGNVITQHELMWSILSKNGVETESNEHRQIRLKKERLAKIRKINVGELQSNVEAKKADLKKAQDVVKAEEQRLKDAVKREKLVSKKEETAIKAQAEAEAKAKDAETQMEEMKKKMAAMEAQLKNGSAKKTESIIVKEPPKEIKEPETPTEEKTIDELIETLK